MDKSIGYPYKTSRKCEDFLCFFSIVIANLLNWENIHNRKRKYLFIPFGICFFFLLISVKSYAVEEDVINGYVFWADSYEEAESIGVEYDVELLEYENGIGVIEAIPEMDNAEAVFYPNYQYEVEGYRWDTNTNEQWHMETLKMHKAHQYATGEGITVAIIDSGIDVENEALKNNIIYAGSTIPDSFYGGSGYSILYQGPQDYNGHGTHVAGLIGAHSENGAIVGMAPDCKLISIKAVEKNGNTATGYTSWISQAVLKAVDLGADIINMSLGGSTRKDEFLAEAIAIAKESGALIVCAAGNYTGSGVQGTVDFPASDPNTIAVSAVKQSALNLEFDNAYSKYGAEITVAAPGTNIKSLGLDGTVKSLKGTSMACALVSGEAALIKSYSPGMTVDKVQECIMNTCLDWGENGWDTLYGYGVIQPLQALKSLDKDNHKKPTDKDEGDKQDESTSFDSEDSNGTGLEAGLESLSTEQVDESLVNKEENGSETENMNQVEKDDKDKQKTKREQLEVSLEQLLPEDEIEYSIQDSEEIAGEDFSIEKTEEVEEDLQETEMKHRWNLATQKVTIYFVTAILIEITGIFIYFLIAKKKTREEKDEK